MQYIHTRLSTNNFCLLFYRIRCAFIYTWFWLMIPYNCMCMNQIYNCTRFPRSPTLVISFMTALYLVTFMFCNLLGFDGYV